MQFGTDTAQFPSDSEHPRFAAGPELLCHGRVPCFVQRTTASSAHKVYNESKVIDQLSVAGLQAL